MTDFYNPAYIHDYDIEITQHEDFSIGFRVLHSTYAGALMLQDTTGFFALFSIFAPDPSGTEVLTLDSAGGSIYLGFTPAPIEQSTAYGLGQQGTTPILNGYIYECTTAGTTDASPVIWPTTIGQTVNYGTTVWTCVSDDSMVVNVYLHIDNGITGALAPWGRGFYTLSVKDGDGHSYFHIDGVAYLRESSTGVLG